MAGSILGNRVLRKEDPRFLTTGGVYVDDLLTEPMLVGAAHVTYVRSTVAHGVITGIDHVPPAYHRLGKVLGLGTIPMYRHVILPAILPHYVSGLTQGWAFAWRSLMAGELLVIIAERPSLGGSLEFARQFSKAPELLATMLVILIIGMLVDGVFSSAARRIRERRGLTADA